MTFKELDASRRLSRIWRVSYVKASNVLCPYTLHMFLSFFPPAPGKLWVQCISSQEISPRLMAQSNHRAFCDVKLQLTVSIEYSHACGTWNSPLTDQGKPLYFLDDDIDLPEGAVLRLIWFQSAMSWPMFQGMNSWRVDCSPCSLDFLGSLMISNLKLLENEPGLMEESPAGIDWWWNGFLQDGHCLNLVMIASFRCYMHRHSSTGDMG